MSDLRNGPAILPAASSVARYCSTGLGFLAADNMFADSDDLLLLAWSGCWRRRPSTQQCGSNGVTMWEADEGIEMRCSGVGLQLSN